MPTTAAAKKIQAVTWNDYVRHDALTVPLSLRALFVMEFLSPSMYCSYKKRRVVEP